ncbi:MAG: twin-arginine translocase TatA/TatE family subunit [Candidatus Hydrothermarchaeaceae archaeon]
MIGVGPQELIVILAIIMLLFGASKIPELARSLGKAKGEFKKGIEEGEDEEVKEKPAEETGGKRRNLQNKQ